MNKIVNISTYQDIKKNNKKLESKDDELIEIDFSFLMKTLGSGKCKNTKELLKVCRQEN